MPALLLPTVEHVSRRVSSVLKSHLHAQLSQVDPRIADTGGLPVDEPDAGVPVPHGVAAPDVAVHEHRRASWMTTPPDELVCRVEQSRGRDRHQEFRRTCGVCPGRFDEGLDLLRLVFFGRRSIGSGPSPLHRVVVDLDRPDASRQPGLGFQLVRMHLRDGGAECRQSTGGDHGRQFATPPHRRLQRRRFSGRLPGQILGDQPRCGQPELLREHQRGRAGLDHVWADPAGHRHTEDRVDRTPGGLETNSPWTPAVVRTHAFDRGHARAPAHCAGRPAQHRIAGHDGLLPLGHEHPPTSCNRTILAGQAI